MIWTDYTVEVEETWKGESSRRVVVSMAGGTLKLSGSTPVVILCRGSFTVNGKIDASGGIGRFGIDTDGGVAYFHYNETTDPGHTTPLSDSIASSGDGGHWLSLKHPLCRS